MKEHTVATTHESPAAKTREQSREETRVLRPPVDIFEKEDGLVVVADVPGAEKSDVDVRVEDGTLTISAKSHGIAPVEPQYREYRLLNFHREFELSEAVDQERINAELKHGVLVVTLPKKEEAKPKRISVEVT